MLMQKVRSCRPYSAQSFPIYFAQQFKSGSTSVACQLCSMKVEKLGNTGLAGVIAFDGDQGFWLLHSNPNFPDNPADSKYTGI